MNILAGYVYIVSAVGTSRYKIGRTVNLDNRIKSLNEQSCYPVKLVYSGYFEDCVSQEKKLHNALSKYRVHGEWFELPSILMESPEKWFHSTKNIKISVNQDLVLLKKQKKNGNTRQIELAPRHHFIENHVGQTLRTKTISGMFIPSTSKDIDLAIAYISTWRSQIKTSTTQESLKSKIKNLIGKVPTTVEGCSESKKILKQCLKSIKAK